LLTREEWENTRKTFTGILKINLKMRRKNTPYQQGKKFGRALKEKMNIHGTDIEALAEVLRAVLKYEPTVRVEIHDGEIHLINEGFCPVMETALAFNLPWGRMCRIMGWPFFTGLAQAVNSNIEFIAPEQLKWRLKGDLYCFHIFALKKV